jgi:hypothetical protein
MESAERSSSCLLVPLRTQQQQQLYELRFFYDRALDENEPHCRVVEQTTVTRCLSVTVTANRSSARRLSVIGGRDGRLYDSVVFHHVPFEAQVTANGCVSE